MNITFRQLKVFEAVARHASFTRAAEELYLTQPAVSMQVKQLEEVVGLPLFEQIGKRIYLTDAGQEMFRYSRAMAQQMTDIETIISELKGVQRGGLVISVTSTANYLASRLLAAFSKRHPGVTVKLDVTNRETALRQLEANEKDLVIMGQPPQELELVSEPFMENPLVVIAPPEHPLAGEQRIPVERLQQEPFVLREAGSGTRSASERFFAQQGLQLISHMEMNSNEAIKQAVQAGLGLGIVSLHTVELELETKRLIVLDVESFPILRYWYVVHRKGKRLAPVAQAFRDFVLQDAVRVAEMKTWNMQKSSAAAGS